MTEEGCHKPVRCTGSFVNAQSTLHWRHESRRSEKAKTVKLVQTSTPKTDTIPYRTKGQRSEGAPVAAPSPRACSSSRWNCEAGPVPLPASLGQLVVLQHGEDLARAKVTEIRRKRSMPAVRENMQSHQVPTAPKRFLEAPAPLGHSAKLTQKRHPKLNQRRQ